MECSFCESKNVILMSGYNYCPKCIHINDKGHITLWCETRRPDIPVNEIISTLESMFKKKRFSYSDIPTLYSILPRGEWIESKKRFAIPTEEYVQNAFEHYLKKESKT